MGKVVYNACFGGFSLSKEAVLRYAELKGLKLYVDETYAISPLYLFCPVEEFKRLYEETRGMSKSLNDLIFSDRDIERDDSALVQVVEELGSEKASGKCAKLAIEELKPGTLYRIEEYDGNESVESLEDLDWKIAK